MRQPIWLRRPSGFKLTDLAGKRLLFYHDFALAPRQAVTKPVVGNAGSFSRGTTRPYFDPDGNYRIADVNELIFTKSPSGLLLPMLSPGATNYITNNSTYSPILFETTLGNSVSWGGDGTTFTLKERVPSSTNTSHATIRTIDGVSTGDVWCFSVVYKPLKGQTKVRLYFRIQGGTTPRQASDLYIPLDGSSLTMPENTWFKYLKVGVLSLPNGYFYLYASVYVKDAEDHTQIQSHLFILNGNDENIHSGDGTAYDIVGADGMYKNIIYPPAPIKTTGSTVTVAQDVLKFPFSEKLPSEGLTAHFECEVGVTAENFLSGQQFLVGNSRESAGGDYSPFGFRVWDVTHSLVLNNQTSGTGRLTSTTVRTSLQLTATETRIYRDGSLVRTNAEAHDLGVASPSPSAIEFKVNQYTPVWLRRYALVKGIVDPNLLLS